MKLASEIAKGMLPKAADKPRLCSSWLGPWGKEPLNEPIHSDTAVCPWCESGENYTWLEEGQWMLICKNTKCASYNRNKKDSFIYIPPEQQKINQWTKFREIWNVGDSYAKCEWKAVQQPPDLKNSIHQFIQTPTGIMIFHGIAGSGKTFAALSVCHEMLQKSDEIIFITQKDLHGKWLASFDKENISTFISRVENTALLVIDDFGICDMSAALLSYFMGLLNTRLQWTKRATILTTNLSPEEMAKYCGTALSDRIRGSKTFNFKSKSRR